jgi:hypothetical protein
MKAFATMMSWIGKKQIRGNIELLLQGFIDNWWRNIHNFIDVTFVEPDKMKVG